ncbi:glycoside hydrolase family 108 protein [Halocynthiibacter styelae]|uniref:Glycoside hydrolase family 108 protein n=1 Tax=Halocynthiibacter styelae TaxID=2761955 RepID=A0A8J7IEW6_9RHOB|nr:glycoside hydrolase family 108 protein [Paenihalocynthiibacter styelae]MBI1495359.1 glycoside hydrolase family 108 protein [Paenihalocynthiibacter styelae]
MNRFERAFALLAVHEGGYVNHPDDPGGATNKGVTQRTYDNYRARHGLAPRHVRQITHNEVAAIYQVQYWGAIQADELPEGLAYCVFDAAVNSGPARAVRWLQAEIGATVDGVIGNETLGLASRADAAALIDRYCDRRLRFMKRLRHWPTFRNGWSARVAEVRAQAKVWVAKQEPAVSTIAPQPKADGPMSTIERLLSALAVLFGKDAKNENL